MILIPNTNLENNIMIINCKIILEENFTDYAELEKKVIYAVLKNFGVFVDKVGDMYKLVIVERC